MENIGEQPAWSSHPVLPTALWNASSIMCSAGLGQSHVWLKAWEHVWQFVSNSNRDDSTSAYHSYWMALCVMLSILVIFNIFGPPKKVVGSWWFLIVLMDLHQLKCSLQALLHRRIWSFECPQPFKLVKAQSSSSRLGTVVCSMYMIQPFCETNKQRRTDRTR